MKKIFIIFTFVFMMISMASCYDELEPKIIVDKSIEVFIDEVFEVEANVEDIKGGYKLIFISIDESIFKVEDDNVIIPVSEGNGELVIKLFETDIEVKVKVYIIESINIELEFLNTEFSILKGEELALVLLGNGEELNSNITWSSSDEAVATINSTGVVLCKSKGTTTIKAEYKDKYIETIITVNPTKEIIGSINVTGIKVLEIDEVIMLSASSDISLATYMFTSNNEDIATITTNGILKGIKEGIATINVVLVEDQAVKTSFEITVVEPRLELSISPSNEIIAGDKGSMVVIRNSKGMVIGRHLCEFRSLNEDILTVDSAGVIAAITVGSTFIEVKYGKATGLVEVIVEEAPELNYRNVLVQTAINEFGYVEGFNNDTKYGTWYGIPNGAWCAMFVSWCAKEVGIPTDVIPKYASVQIGMDWFKAKGSDYYKSYEETQSGDYVPICGDIIFFKSNGASHTGIVVKVVDDIMYTIEGNTSNKVALRYYYYKDYDKITGYGVPNYQSSSTEIRDFDVTRATFGGGESTT